MRADVVNRDESGAARDDVKSSAAFLAASSKDHTADFPRGASYLHPLSHLGMLESVRAGCQLPIPVSHWCAELVLYWGKGNTGSLQLRLPPHTLHVGGRSPKAGAVK